MTDTILTLDQLNTLFQSMTLSMLGLDPTAWNAYQAALSSNQPWTDAIPANPFYNVRVAWPKEGAPAWKIDEDVVFLQVFETDDQINRQREIKNDAIDGQILNQEMSFTQVVTVNWIFYGPNSYDNSRKVKNQVFYQNFHDFLAKNGLYIVPDMSAPRRMPDAFSGQWWERVDLSMRFNELVIVNSNVGIASGASIVLNVNQGPESTIQAP